jgi:hypothetical protein
MTLKGVEAAKMVIARQCDDFSVIDHLFPICSEEK